MHYLSSVAIVSGCCSRRVSSYHACTLTLQVPKACSSDCARVATGVGKARHKFTAPREERSMLCQMRVGSRAQIWWYRKGDRNGDDECGALGVDRASGKMSQEGNGGVLYILQACHC